jgi:hypothetical protein
MFTPGSRRCGYKTVSGRQEWLNRDPIAEAGGIDLYKFVGNSPINWIDPFGLEGGPGEGEEGGGGYGDDGEGYGGGFGKYGGYPSESPGGVPYNNGSVEDQVAAFIYMRLAEGDTLVLIPKSK